MSIETESIDADAGGSALGAALPDSPLPAMLAAARQAGDLLLARFADRAALTVTAKTAGDFVSEADVAAESLLRALLMAARPGYGWLGEEQGAIPGTDARHCWVVDPLDGTTNFLHGHPHWAVSVALLRDGVPVAGVVHDPAKGETFAAEQGAGATLNGAPLRVSACADLSAALLATGVPNGARVAALSQSLADIGRLMPLSAGVRRNGAAALDLAWVAAGRFEGYWERNLGAHDIAAGVLLVTEAGGQVRPLQPGTQVLATGSVLATNAALGPELARLLGAAP